MRLLRRLEADDRVTIAASVTALALPPPTYGVVPDWWSTGNKTSSYATGDRGVVPQLELEVWAAAAVNLTAAVLYGAVQQPFVYADQTVTFDGTLNKVAKAAHGLMTGDGPLFFTTAGGALPVEIVAGTGYYAIYDAAGTFKLATTLQNALAGTAIDFTGNGTGTTTISDSADTMRVHWHASGLLGDLGDGAIALDAQTSWRKRLDHSSRVVAYAIVATLGGAVATSAAIWPVVDA